MDVALKPRHIGNLILPWLMWAASSIPMVTGVGRSASDLSESSDTLLVPAGIAFSIWFPIFVGCIAYGIVQFLPKNRARPVFVEIGNYTALAFLGVMGWGVLNAYIPSVEMARWSTALIFIPTMLSICHAVSIGSARANELSRGERMGVFWPLCWLAGWSSLAVFLNWAQLGVHDVLGFGMDELMICLLTLAAALGWGVIMLRRTGGNFAYLFPIIWGLCFLVLARTSHDMPNLSIAITAGVGVIVLIGTALSLRAKNYLDVA